MLKNIPFFANTPDDTHCFQAALKMVLKYYLPDKDFTFEDLDKLSDKVANKGTWPTKAFINLHQMGFEIINMENFDYHKFSQSGYKYLVKKMGKEVADVQKKFSNLDKEMVDAKEYIEIFGNKFVLPEIKDIRNFIDLGYLVVCNVNSRDLNNKVGYTGHFVVIYDYDDNKIFLHDPGLPGQPNREVPLVIFSKAWAFPDHDSQNLAAIKLKLT